MKRLIGDREPPATPPEPVPYPVMSAEARGVHEAFWILLGRQASEIELRDQIREADAGGEPALLRRVISSTEFRQAFAVWKEGRSRSDAGEAALSALGADDRFVDRAYELLLGRTADPEGRQHYVAALAAGETRSSFVSTLIRSEEFAQRYRDLAPDELFVPRDTQLCELANPAKWDNPEWMTLLRDLKVITPDKAAMHRKGYEFTQLVYGLGRLGRLGPDATVLSVGAGHEAVLYWLANHVGAVIGTDMYEEGRWSSVGIREGDARVIARPQDYAPFPYREDRLMFLKMDGRHLGFRSHTFDIAYSLSSIEHFGGLTGAQAAVDEMVRVLKPGGILVLATEYMLGGTPHEEVFQPADVHALINRPGLRLVQPIDELVYRRYEYPVVDLYRNRFQAPHMVVQMGGTIFTTVMMFLEKAPI
ncbi:MAG: methyltransferase domain-containing protein [Acidobacteriota bacterium]